LVDVSDISKKVEIIQEHLVERDIKDEKRRLLKDILKKKV
jgi:hypothetical protein